MDGGDPDSSQQAAGQSKKDLKKDLRSSRREAKKLENKPVLEGPVE